MQKLENKSTDTRALTQAHAARYAPRARSLATGPARPSLEDARLRKLAAQVLDELKRPDAIPSRVLLAALTQAKALGTA